MDTVAQRNIAYGLAGVLAVILIGLAVLLWMPGPGVPDTGTATTTPQATTTPGGNATTTAPVFRSVDIAVLDTAGASAGKTRGCDRVVMLPRTITPTTAPLSAALRALFAIESEQVNGWFNFVARTNDTLAFDRAEVRGGVAHIYLTGSLSGLAGVCDDPRARIQIEETALQFPSVQSVQLYLNGTATNLTPSEK